ncbi:MAG: adenylosuccinate synthase [Candidatus Thermoplasmatota archaeon]|nr:adenylosuccinate synthase [Candidatus Thermoplasmatota archaeon]MCL6002704.1 adenylosuccinate synthase [Candidatus Thermoplasmatota archaeon]
METLTLVGCQFGDEGKGKIIDYLSKDFDINVRFNGGENAGHTVVVGDKTIKYHLVPAGFLGARTVVISNGVVVNLKKLVEEIEFLKKFRNNFDLKISEIAHVVTGLHFQRDSYLEKLRGTSHIGTTLKGIGPAYESKFGRYGIRLVDFRDRDKLEENLALLSKVYQIPFDGTYVDDLMKDYSKINRYLTDTRSYLENELEDGKKAMFETAQGTFIDVESGTYPFVTSSYTTTAGVTVGTGLSPKYFKKFLGVAKAYTTRVGEGVFPTEMFGPEADELRKLGNEFGSTTGRPRRVGYLDLPILRRAAKLNSLDYIALTKVDVLGKLNSVRVAVSYESNGSEIDEFDPTRTVDKINYESFKPWAEDSSKLQYYVDFIQDELRVPIVLIGVGEKREAIELNGKIAF